MYSKMKSLFKLLSSIFLAVSVIIVIFFFIGIIYHVHTVAVDRIACEEMVSRMELPPHGNYNVQDCLNNLWEERSRRASSY